MVIEQSVNIDCGLGGRLQTFDTEKVSAEVVGVDHFLKVRIDDSVHAPPAVVFPCSLESECMRIVGQDVSMPIGVYVTHEVVMELLHSRSILQFDDTSSPCTSVPIFVPYVVPWTVGVYNLDRPCVVVQIINIFSTVLQLPDQVSSGVVLPFGVA